MRLYEIFVILHPRLSEEEVNSFASSLEKQLADRTLGGAMTGRKVELDQSLSYPISHQLRGHFIHLEMEVSSEEEVSNEVHRDMQMENDVMRYLVFRKPSKSARTAQKSSQESSVIDRMRTQQKEQTSANSSTTEVKTKEEDKSTTLDEKEVDKKIEELLS